MAEKDHCKFTAHFDIAKFITSIKPTKSKSEENQIKIMAFSKAQTWAELEDIFL